MTRLPDLDVLRIADGLWRWTAPHPEWTPDKDRPGGWGRMVGCVYYEPADPPGAPVILIEPLAPPAGTTDGDRFWTALDLDLERARRPVSILLGNSFHLRAAPAFRERLASDAGCAVVAHPATIARLGLPGIVPFDAGLSRAGVEAIPLDALDPGETAFFIREHRALIFSDAVLGAGGGRLAVAPPSWGAKGEEAAALYRRCFRSDLKRLLDLDPEVVLPSHGAPILAKGRETLAAALDAPAWGE
jgi:glyoxylase-like metal-dependent hydrolase (beta-lactamase superfamily II)